VGDNADDFPNDATETKDTDGDGMGDNEQAELEAQLAAEEAEAAAARTRLMIGGGLALLVVAGAVVFFLRSRSDGAGAEVTKDFGMPDMNAQPTASTGYDPMATTQAYQPTTGYDSMATAQTFQPATTQPVAIADDSALNAFVEPEPVAAAAVAMPEAVAAPVEPSVVNQWTDENGHTWRVMSDGTNRWWNGTDWQKV